MKFRGVDVFVVVDKRGRPCTGNVYMGLTMPIAEFKRFLSEGNATVFGGRVWGVKRWVRGEKVVKMRLVPVSAKRKRRTR